MKLRAITTSMAAILAISAASTQAQVESVGTEPDIQCLLALSILAAEEDEDARRAGEIGAMFFTGKLFGREPDIDLKTRMLSAAKSLDRSIIPASLVRCGNEMKSRGDALQEAGRYLSTQGF